MTYSINFQSVGVINLYMCMYSYLPHPRPFMYLYINKLIFLVWGGGGSICTKAIYTSPRSTSENLKNLPYVY